MTGIELLKEELLKRGYSKQQIGSKVIPAVLSIVADPKYAEVIDARKDLDAAVRELSIVRTEIFTERMRLEHLKAEIAEKEAERDKVGEYIRKFNADLEQMETPEMRDRLRTAQLFTNSVVVTTDANMSVYMASLASILTGVRAQQVDQVLSTNAGYGVYLQKRSGRRL